MGGALSKSPHHVISPASSDSFCENENLKSPPSGVCKSEGLFQGGGF